MRLAAEIDGEEIALDVRRGEREGRVLAEVGGRRYEVEVREPEPGVYLLLAGGRVYECRVSDAGGRAGAARVSVRGRAYGVALWDPKRLRGAGAGGAGASGRAEVRAPMPGKVVRLLVGHGAEVAAGEGLVVVEAMKMQNEMKSPKAGRVVEIHAAAGATVNAGDVLVVVE